VSSRGSSAAEEAVNPVGKPNEKGKGGGGGGGKKQKINDEKQKMNNEKKKPPPPAKKKKPKSKPVTDVTMLKKKENRLPLPYMIPTLVFVIGSMAACFFFSFFYLRYQYAAVCLFCFDFFILILYFQNK
jgi:hypothetical protein